MTGRGGLGGPPGLWDGTPGSGFLSVQLARPGPQASLPSAVLEEVRAAAQQVTPWELSSTSTARGLCSRHLIPGHTHSPGGEEPWTPCCLLRHVQGALPVGTWSAGPTGQPSLSNP